MVFQIFEKKLPIHYKKITSEFTTIASQVGLSIEQKNQRIAYVLMIFKIFFSYLPQQVYETKCRCDKYNNVTFSNLKIILVELILIRINTETNKIYLANKY